MQDVWIGIFRLTATPLLSTGLHDYQFCYVVLLKISCDRSSHVCVGWVLMMMAFLISVRLFLRVS